MKFTSLLVSTLLGAVARTSTAESTCCNADQNLGCASDSPYPYQASTMTVNGFAVVVCCANADLTTNINNVDGNPVCEGTVIPDKTPTTTETTTDAHSIISSSGLSSCTDLESQFEGCACIQQCAGSDAQCTDSDGSTCDESTAGCANGAKPLHTCSSSSILSMTQSEAHSESSSSSSSTTTTTTTTTTTGNAGAGDDGNGSGAAGIISSTFAIGASVAFIAMIFV